MSDKEDAFDERAPRPDFNSTSDLTGNRKEPPATSARERLRRRTLNTSSSVDSGSSAPTTPSSGFNRATGRRTLTSSNSKNATELRKKLLQKRQSERNAGIDSDDDVGAGGGGGGPRSPARFGSRSALREQQERSSSDDSDRPDAGLVDADSDGEELCLIDEAQAWYPLQVSWQSRAEAEAAQPLLTLPQADMLVDPDALFNPRRIPPPTELNLMTGNAKVTATADNVNASLLGGANEPDEEDDEEGLLHADGARAARNGIHVGQTPTMAAVLLHSAETLPASLGKTIEGLDPSLRLARATQRLLREARAEGERKLVKDRFEAAKAGAADPLITPSSRRGGNDRTGNKENDSDAARNTAAALAAAPLLRSLPHVGPVMKIIENPLDERASVAVLPDTSRAVGGVLGNWGADASMRERLGPLSLGHDKRSGCRVVLRVHLHQLHLHEYPLMNAEEVQFCRLKNTYSMYRSIVEQRTLLFLSERLKVLEAELQRLLRLKGITADAADFDPDDALLFNALYADFCETLPLLAELRISVDSLTASILDQWKAIKEHRRNSGFISTRATVTVRAVRGSGGGSGGPTSTGSGGSPRKGRGEAKTRFEDEEAAAGSAAADVEGDDGSASSYADDGWDSLAPCLSRVPSLVSKVQAALLVLGTAAMDEEEAAEAAAAAADASKSADADAGAAKGAGGKPPKPARGATAASSSTSASMRRSDSSLTDTGGVFSPRSRTRQLQQDFQRHSAMLEAAAGELLRTKCLMPEYWLRLDSDGAVTPTAQLEAQELTRRAEIEGMHVKAVILVNGKRITETRLSPLKYPTLSVDLGQYFEFRLLHEMDKLSVDIVAQSPSWFASEVHLASVPVPFPGQMEGRKMSGMGSGRGNQTSAHSLAPVSGWLHFGGFGQPMQPGEVRAGYGGLVQENGNDSTQVIRGSLLVVCEYDVASAESRPPVDAQYRGIEEGSLAVLPPPSEEDHATAWGSGYSLGGGMTAARLLPGIKSMDPNDPRNDILASRAAVDPLGLNQKVFHLYGHSFAVAFTEGGDSYENFFRFKEGPRSQLLRLREHQPHLFTEPIPLSDAEVRSSELYRRMLTTHVSSAPLLHLDTSLGSGNADSKAQLLQAQTEAAEKGMVKANKLKSFLSRVRGSGTAQARHARKKKLTTSAAVAETQYFHPIVEIDLEDLLPEKRRSLKPRAQSRSQAGVHVNNASLLVQVVAARNVPLRAELDRESSGQRGGAPASSNMTRGGHRSALQGSMKMPRGRLSRSPTRGSGMENADSGNESGGEGEKPQIAEALLDESKVLMSRRARTCVEVRFQEHRESTTAIAGGSPIWKQSFSLPFRPPNDDFTPSNLSQVRDLVVFSLFDEIEEDDARRGTALEGENTRRTERRFLGSFVLPFKTVYTAGRIEGIFRLQTPVLNFGYLPAGPIVGAVTRDDQVFEEDLAAEEAVVHKPTFLQVIMQSCFKLQRRPSAAEYGHFIHSNTAAELDGFASGDGSTYLKLMATLDPLLATLPEIPMDMSSSNLYAQDRPFGPYASVWLRGVCNYSQYTKVRKYRVFGQSSDGLYTLVCRYLHPQQPPEGFRTTRSAIHLVSQLPYMSDIHSFEDPIDFWCTSKETWEIGAGDEEEHAVMLFNYLYYFSLVGEEGTVASGNTRQRRVGADVSGAAMEPANVQNESVFLAMGRAEPEGDTCYVLLRDKNVKANDPFSSKNFLVINPCTGHVYSAMDPSCPLREIYTLVTPYNLWANIQYTNKLREYSFNLLDVDMWRPFFGTRLPAPVSGLHTVQDDIMYTPTSTGYALEVETQMLASIKNSIRRWRSKRYRSTTTFHPDACSILSDLLPRLDKYKRGGGTNTTSVTAMADLDVERLMDDAERKMAPILRTRAFRGAPINTPFTDIDEVLNTVKALGVHENRHPEVQFVLAVKAVPLFNETVSLWIFLGTLEAHGSTIY